MTGCGAISSWLEQPAVNPFSVAMRMSDPPGYGGALCGVADETDLSAAVAGRTCGRRASAVRAGRRHFGRPSRRPARMERPAPAAPWPGP